MKIKLNVMSCSENWRPWQPGRSKPVWKSWRFPSDPFTLFRHLNRDGRLLNTRLCELGEEDLWHRGTMLEYSTRSDVRHFLQGGKNKMNIIGQRHIQAYTRKGFEHVYTYMNMYVHAYMPIVHWLKHKKMH